MTAFSLGTGVGEGGGGSGTRTILLLQTPCHLSCGHTDTEETEQGTVGGQMPWVI